MFWAMAGLATLPAATAVPAPNPESNRSRLRMVFTPRMCNIDFRGRFGFMRNFSLVSGPVLREELHRECATSPESVVLFTAGTK